MDSRLFYEEQVKSWSTPPIGGRNLASRVLQSWTDQEVRGWVAEAYVRQYAQPSNWKGLYRSSLKLDSTMSCRVLDYGCGFGFDALSYARMGNLVSLADINPDNLEAATRVLNVFGYSPYAVYQVPQKLDLQSMLEATRDIDVFHCSGVFHHLTLADQETLLAMLQRIVRDGGELRLLVYTHVLWYVATGTALPERADLAPTAEFKKFVRYCDAVGNWADYFTPDKMERLADKLGWMLDDWTWLRRDAGYGVAILKRA